MGNPFRLSKATLNSSNNELAKENQVVLSKQWRKDSDECFTTCSVL